MYIWFVPLRQTVDIDDAVILYCYKVRRVMCMHVLILKEYIQQLELYPSSID